MAKTKALVKAQEARKITKKMMLIPGLLKAQQLLFITQQTPAEHIYHRPGKGGGTWDYVTGVYVKKILNYTFGWLWDFEIKDKGREGDLVWVQGRLTIKNKKGEAMIVKEQFGRADVKFKKNTKIPLDYGNDLKAAATDALKKCAAELGIASDIYGKEEFKEIQRVDKKFISPENGNGKPAENKTEKLFASETEKERIKKIAREMGINTIGGIERKIGLTISWKSMTRTQATMILAALLVKQVKK